MCIKYFKPRLQNIINPIASWTMLVILAGLVISVVGFIELQDITRERLYIATENAVKAKAEQLQTNIQISLDALERVATIYHAVGDMSSQQLQESFTSESNYQPGTMGLAWVGKVAATNSKQFEEQLTRESGVDSHIYALTGHGVRKEAGDKEVFFPVRAVYPSVSADLEPGLDISSIPSRYAVMNKAFHGHHVAITDRFSLFINEQHRYGFQAFYPVYSDNVIYDELLGYVIGIYDFERLLGSLSVDPSFQLTLHDVGSSSEQLLFSSTQKYTSVSEVLLAKELHWSFPLKVADKQWMLTVFPEQQWLNGNGTSFIPYLWLLAGMILTSLLAIYLVISLGKFRQISTLTNHLEVQRALKKEAESANQAKSNLLRAASHDLRQPLHTIGLLSGLIEQTTDTQEQKKWVSRMVPAVKAMQSMFSALLDISQLDSGQLTIQKRSFELYPILEKLYLRFELEAEEKGLALRLVDVSACVHTDPVLLETMLSNLIANAIRYTHTGKILLGCRRRGNCIRIGVIDTGIGMDEETQDHVTEEFYRDEAAIKLCDQGLGLGLSIVSKLANKLALNFGFSSRKGKGSYFYIDVPRVEKSDESAGQAASQNLMLNLNKNVWIIEDEQHVAQALSALLTSWGCASHHLIGSQQLKQMLENKTITKPDAIIADYQLHNETGLEVISLIEQHFGISIPTLIVTATEGMMLTDEFEVMLKPVEPLVLNQWLVHLP